MLKSEQPYFELRFESAFCLSFSFSKRISSARIRIFDLFESCLKDSISDGLSIVVLRQASGFESVSCGGCGFLGWLFIG